MKETRLLWDRFEKSGKLRDYMEYRAALRREKEDPEGEKPGGDAPQSSL